MKLLVAALLALAPRLALAALAAPAPDAATLERRLAPCLACHGATGRSLIPEVPSLGAQPEFFLTVQLLMFREGMRNIEPMTAMLRGWSDEELRRGVSMLAKLAAPPAAGEPLDGARAERARALVVQHRCNFCHKGDFSGEQNAPRLAGQREDYLIKALRDYKSDARRAYDTAMADVMYPLSDADIGDLAHYLARFR